MEHVRKLITKISTTSMHKLVIGILIVLILFIVSNKYFFTDNKETVLHIINPTKTKDSLPTTEDNLMRIDSYIQNNFPDDPNKYTFIDFGCGYGDVLIALHKHFKNSVGIEIDSSVCEKATENVKKYNSIQIINKDMSQYNFQKINTVLFMYEPLWSVNKNTANKIYNKVFNNINTVFNHSSEKFYIIYVTGLKRKDIDEKFIKRHKFKIIFKIEIGKKFVKRYIYILDMNK